MIDNLSAYPSYYAHMGPANTAGPGPAHLDVPQPVNTEELSARLEHGEWVIGRWHTLTGDVIELRW